MNQNFLIRAVIAVSAETYSITSYLRKMVFLIWFRFFWYRENNFSFQKTVFCNLPLGFLGIVHEHCAPQTKQGKKERKEGKVISIGVNIKIWIVLVGQVWLKNAGSIYTFCCIELSTKQFRHIELPRTKKENINKYDIDRFQSLF